MCRYSFGLRLSPSPDIARVDACLAFTQLFWRLNATIPQCFFPQDPAFCRVFSSFGSYYRMWRYGETYFHHCGSGDRSGDRAFYDADIDSDSDSRSQSNANANADPYSESDSGAT